MVSEFLFSFIQCFWFEHPSNQNSVITDLLQFFLIKQENPFFKDYKSYSTLPPNAPPFRKNLSFSKIPRLRQFFRLVRADCRQDGYRAGLSKLQHACPKRHAKDFLGTRHSLLSQFLLSDQRLYIVKNMCIYAHIWLCTDCVWITVGTKQHSSETF